MRSLRCLSLLTLSLAFCLDPGPSGGARANPAGCPEWGVVFVANGSGESYSATDGLSVALKHSGLPIRVETVVWSRFSNEIMDHADHYGQIAAGHEIARQATAYRQKYPGNKVFILAHSSGNRVALVAAELVPPGTVDRIFLLAPSVVYCYDLRNALRGTRDGIDSFHSGEDQVLEMAVAFLGTADGHKAPTAGQIGFALPHPSLPDAPLYRKLRQHRWTSRMEWTGHTGGHYGWTVGPFIYHYVLPLMLRSEATERPAG